MSKRTKPLSRKDEIVVQDIDSDVLIYDLRSNKAFCLNETSALVWRACDGSRDVVGISDFVSRELNAPANEDLVWLALDQLKKEKLLERAPEPDGRFDGMSRREVLYKVGAGSMLAIPVIAALAAPTAAQTASACQVLNCMNDMDCTDVNPGCTVCSMALNDMCAP